MAKKYELSTGWKAMKRDLWEWKFAGIEEYYYRRLRTQNTASERFKHRVVFQYHGDPPESWWDSWEQLAKGSYEKGAVKVLDYRNHGLSSKRKRKPILYCQECGVRQDMLHNNLCAACHTEQEKWDRAFENHEESLQRQHSKELEEAQSKLRELQIQTKQYSTQCISLQRKLQLSKHMAKQKLQHDHLCLKKALKEQAKTFQDKNLRLQNALKEEAELSATTQNRLCEAFLELLSQGHELRQQVDKNQSIIMTLKANLNQFETVSSKQMAVVQKLVTAKRSDFDIVDGLFSKALLSDFYHVGIFPLSSKKKVAYGTISCRRGNIALYHKMLKPLIDRIIGVNVPIVNEIENGRRMHYNGELGARLRYFGYNVEFGTMDIVYKRKWSLRDPDRKRQLFQLYSWFKNDWQNEGQYENSDGTVYSKSQFYEAIEDPTDFQNVFCSLAKYHRNHGLKQTHGSVSRNDYSDFTFYVNESLMVSLSREKHHLHLHTYCHTSEYYYQEPSLIKNEN
jgi:hypothetical protein